MKRPQKLILPTLMAILLQVASVNSFAWREIVTPKIMEDMGSSKELTISQSAGKDVLAWREIVTPKNFDDLKITSKFGFLG